MNNIEIILKELENYRVFDRKAIFTQRIKERLDKSLKEYYRDLNKSINKLELYQTYDNLKAIKKINKEL